MFYLGLKWARGIYAKNELSGSQREALLAALSWPLGESGSIFHFVIKLEIMVFWKGDL